jgi:Whirly transcription factor
MNTTIQETSPVAPSSSPRQEGSALERNPDYSVYKPNSRGTGGVMRFGFNVQKAAIFVESAAQSGEKQFDWERKIIMKWGLSDIGSVLATFQGRTPQAKLFHQSEKGSSTCELIYREDPERAPYLITISRQDAADKSLRKVTIPLSYSEAAILETALKTAIDRILAW